MALVIRNALVLTNDDAQPVIPHGEILIEGSKIVAVGAKVEAPASAEVLDAGGMVAKPGLITAVVMSFAHTVGEFGVVLMIGGNIPGVTRTLSITIYDDVQSLDYASAGQTAIFLLGFAFVVLCLAQLLSRRGASL